MKSSFATVAIISAVCVSAKADTRITRALAALGVSSLVSSVPLRSGFWSDKYDVDAIKNSDDQYEIGTVSVKEQDGEVEIKVKNGMQLPILL